MWFVFQFIWTRISEYDPASPVRPRLKLVFDPTQFFSQVCVGLGFVRLSQVTSGQKLYATLRNRAR